MTQLLQLFKQKAHFRHASARHYTSREVEAILNEQIADEIVAEVKAKHKRI